MANLLAALLQGVTGINPSAPTEVEGVDVVARKRPPPAPADPIRNPMTPEYIEAVKTANGVKMPRPEGSKAGIWGLLPDNVRNSSLRDVLGAIGDGLLIRDHADPIYRPRREAAQVGQAMIGYGQDPQAAIERVASSGVPGAIEIAKDLQTNLQTSETRQALQEANTDYRKSLTQNRNDSLIARMEPYATTIMRNVKTPEQYNNAYLRLKQRLQKIDPESDPTSAYGLPEPDEWQPGQTDQAGMTGGQMERATVSREAIQQRREAAAQTSRDRRASIAARPKPQATEATLIEEARRRIEAGTATETDKQRWKRYIDGTTKKGGKSSSFSGKAGGQALPASSIAAYNSGTAAQKAQARKAWAAQGFDTSKLK